MNWDDENLRAPAGQRWWHATVSFPGDAGVTTEAAAVLLAALSGQQFHFLRKEGKLRLRTERPADSLLDKPVADHLATGWVVGIYEPEVGAFGGPDGMAIAHAVFCADSRAALAEASGPHAKEQCVLLISTMNRAAGPDPFETGDVWARVADLRPVTGPPARGDLAAAVAGMRRWADTSLSLTTSRPCLAAGSPLPPLTSTRWNPPRPRPPTLPRCAKSWWPR